MRVPKYGITENPALEKALKGANYRGYTGPLDLNKYSEMLLAHTGDELLKPLDFIEGDQSNLPPYTPP